ncbi:MAG: hypothetical protein K2J59_08260 [Eubacterium sp.]|nr:hypothetical protein [Eubacterium sp.]
MSECRCKYCGDEFEYDELEYDWCPECIDEVTCDTDLMLEYIQDHSSGLLKPTLEHEFFVDYCYSAEDKRKSVDLMLLCKYKVLEDIKLNANGRRELLSEFVKNDLSHYLDWVEKKEAEDLRAKSICLNEIRRYLKQEVKQC